ncbi:MAG: histidine phosphatase family protein [Oceanospirillum sp.]|nr:histidine phosphatase family protein [Oceanospirillum sp.]
MRLVLFRHGEAGVAARDFDRCLTDSGVADVRKVACYIADQLSGATAHVSPYMRARQTCSEIERNAELQSCHELSLITPEDSPQQVIDWLNEQPSDRPLLLVTHQPLVSRLISLLVDGHDMGFYPMATASVTVLEADVWGAGLARLDAVVHAADLE